MSIQVEYLEGRGMDDLLVIKRPVIAVDAATGWPFIRQVIKMSWLPF